MRITYPINYSGYIPLLRRVLLLVKSRILTLQELGLYISFVMQADFDTRHRNYRTILRDDRQLGKEFGLSPSTIFRYRKRFIYLGLLTEEEGLTKITNYRVFELDWVQKVAKIPHLSPEELFLTPQEEFADIETSIANLQQESGQYGPKSSNSNVSFKSNSFKSSLWLDHEDEIRK